MKPTETEPIARSGEGGQSGRGAAAKRVVAAKIKHETNGFNRVLTTLEDFRSQELHEGPGIRDYYRGTRLEMGAFLDAADRLGWKVALPVATFAGPSGVVADEAFEFLLGRLTRGLEAEDRIDGVLLSLHGSMFTQSQDDAEGEILARVRAVVGPAVPVAITLDPHANVTRKMVDHADILTSFRTSPHTDQYETGLRAAAMLDRAMQGHLAPRLYFARRPMLQGFDGARTYRKGGPMLEALRRAAGMESDPGVACVSIQAGYSRCDIPEFGPTVVITADGEQPQCQQMAESLMDFCWETRGIWSDPLVTIEEAVQAARLAPQEGPPLVLGDYGDAPGGGSYGDSTRLASALLAAGVRNVALANIHDPATAAQATAAGVGAVIEVALGGHSDPASMGEPIRARAQVLHLSDGKVTYKGPYGTGTRRDCGPTVLLRIEGLSVVVTSRNVGIYDLEQFRMVGVEPTTCSVLVVKCMQGHHAAFDPIASRTLDVDTGGLTSADLSRFRFTRVSRPVWPLDPIDHPHGGHA